MKGSNEVITALNATLGAELQSINQYMLHSGILESIGHPKLAAWIKKEAIDEMHHAEKLLARILFLDGTPVLGPSQQITMDKEPQAILRRQLELENEAVQGYRQAAAIANQLGDYVSRNLFESLLAAEEEHYDWLDTQLGLIERLGFVQYETALIVPS